MKKQISKEDLYKSFLPKNNFNNLIIEKIIKLEELLKKLSTRTIKNEVLQYNINFIKTRINALKQIDVDKANKEVNDIYLKNTLKCGNNEYVENQLEYILEKICTNCLMIRLDNFDISQDNLSVQEICEEVLKRLNPSNYSLEYDSIALIEIIKSINPEYSISIYDAMKIIIDYIEKEFIKTDEITSYYKNRKNRL